MRKNKIYLILLLILVALIRLILLGGMPVGVSLFEISVGNILSTNNIFLIRLPFAIISIFTVYLSFVVAKKITSKDNLALITALLVAITPWHIQFSRIANIEIILFTIFLSIFLFLLTKKRLKIFKTFFIASTSLLVVISVLRFDSELSNRVNDERHLVSNQITGIVPKIFSNKLTETTQQVLNQYFEKLDFGYYFFKGQPKPRWGSEELQRMLIIQLPLTAYGFYLSKKKTKFLFVKMFIFVSLLSLFVSRYNADLEFVNVFLFSYLSAVAIIEIKSRKKLAFLAVLIFMLFEVFSFLVPYYNGYEDSIFSGRRPHFEQLVAEVQKLDSDKILVSDRINNAEKYFDFYLPGNSYEFRSYSIRDEELNYDYYVSVLPDEVSPVEELYSQDGWPDGVDVVSTIYDPTQRLTNVIFRYDSQK